MQQKNQNQNQTKPNQKKKTKQNPQTNQTKKHLKKKPQNQTNQIPTITHFVSFLLSRENEKTLGRSVNHTLMWLSREVI